MNQRSVILIKRNRWRLRNTNARRGPGTSQSRPSYLATRPYSLHALNDELDGGLERANIRRAGCDHLQMQINRERLVAGLDGYVPCGTEIHQSFSSTR